MFFVSLHLEQTYFGLGSFHLKVKATGHDHLYIPLLNTRFYLVFFLISNPEKGRLRLLTNVILNKYSSMQYIHEILATHFVAIDGTV